MKSINKKQSLTDKLATKGLLKKIIAFSGLWLLFLYVALIQLDPDFGWHLQAGNYFRVYGIPTTDIFTYTASDFLWINHEWLNDVFLSILYDLGGYVLPAILSSFLWAIVVWLSSGKKNLIVLVLASLALAPYSGIRPIIWSLLFFTLLLRIIYFAPAKQWFLPAIFLIWANLHGGFALGLIVMAGFAFFTQRINWTVIGLSVLATFINPYGANLYIEIARTTFDSSLRWNIIEWLPFHYASTTSLYLEVFIAFYWLAETNKLRSFVSLRGLLLLMAFSSSRHTPFFILSTITPYENYSTKLAEQIKKAKAKPKKRLIWRVMSISFVAVVLYSIWATVPLRLNKETQYPVKTTEYLNVNPCRGNLFNSYNFGGYLIWKLPDHPVYIDGRMPSWSHNNRKYLDDYIKIFKEDDFRKEEFEKYSITCVLAEKTVDNRSWLERLLKFNPPINLADKLQIEGWVVTAEDNASVLLISPPKQE